MKLQKDLIDAFDPYLDSIPIRAVFRGRAYLAEGKVTALECITPNQLYAATVRCNREYEVGLEYDFGEWIGECSCSQEEDCKHIAAAVLALQAKAEVDPASAPVCKEPAKNGKAKNFDPVPPQTKPPSSPLAAKVQEALGRELRREEKDFVAQVRNLHHTARTRHLFDSEIVGLIPQQRYGPLYSWEPVHLWPDFPRDDYAFWLHIAWDLRRRNLRLPEFMEQATDLSLIEPAMKDWEREKEIARWKTWFGNFQAQPPASDPVPLDLRLAIFDDHARLQWRSASDAPFADFKKSHAKDFGDLFERGILAMGPDSLPLWSAAYKPWNYESWWSFKYSDSTARPALNRLLRMPLPPERLVTGSGETIVRVGEPLRLSLCPPQNGDATYRLALAAADGSALSRILCVLAGKPALYLTERALYQGPPADAFDTASSKTIPAEALESKDGIRFLHRLGLPVPSHLQDRVRTVPVKVRIQCKLKPLYLGSRNEMIALAVDATAPGIPREIFTSYGWQDESRYESQKKPNPADSDGILVHDREAQKHFPRVMDQLGAKWTSGSCYPGEWTLRLSKKTPETFVPWLKSLPPEIEVVLEGELATLRDEPLSGTVSLDVSEAEIDWFDLKVVLNVEDTTLTPEELKLLLNARGGYVRLGSKGWRRLQFNVSPEEEEQLSRLGLTAREFSAEPQRFHALQLADPAAKKFLGPDRVEAIERRASELKARVTPPIPQSIRAEMRPYQTEGFHFLAYLVSNRFGGVLADDMGLGKTLQSLAWLAWLREAKAPATPLPSLVVCPKSVMDNWRAEAERFYPGLRVRTWRGESADELGAARENADLIVINYAQLRCLWPPIASLQWHTAILDEAQCIKNPDSQTAQAARALNASHRLALTGTPIENRLLDLWSIFAFAMPGVLGNRANFLRGYDGKNDPLARRRLAARVRPFLLRRAKSQVAKDLPDRIEEDLLCEMEGAQHTLYQAELKRARQLILGLQTDRQLNEARFNVLTSLLRLRQICCHPALVDATLVEAESAKLAALEDLLDPLMEEGHKVLVFSQFVTMLDLLRKKMEQRKWPYFFLAGDTENRGELVRDFQSAPGGAVFLISLKAGGFGLNLTAASYVVLFDPWWNPAVENQAIDRTHRIGQTSKVIAYRLLMRESVEQKIRELQKQKAALASDVLGEERFAQSLTLDDLRFLFADA